MRRKTLLNAILKSNNIEYSKEEILNALNKIGVVENIRGEVLTLEQYLQIANILLNE